jgi:hypothetical protein
MTRRPLLERKVNPHQNKERVAAARTCRDATKSGLELSNAQQFRQLGDIGRDPSRLVLREQLGLNVRFTPKSGHWNSAARCPLCADFVAKGG